MLAFKFILLIASVLIGYFLGFFLTDAIDLSKYKALNFKAFTCRPCLSFHIAWVSSTITGLLMRDWWMVLIGIAFAFVLFIGLKIDEHERTITLEEYDEIDEKQRLEKNEVRES